MRYIVVGAGAVGATIGGRLHESGHEVVLVARGAHLEALRDRGLTLRTPDGTQKLRVPVAAGPGELSLRADDVLVLAVKTQDTQAALDAWAPVADRLPVVCAQNGVANERMALRRFRDVYGMCVWLPSTHLEPGEVVAPCGPLTGILHLGRYPHGTDDLARAVSADLEKSSFAAPVVPDVMRWKYAKLLSNLGNAVEALCGGWDETAAGLLDRAKAEGTAVLDAAGIPYAGVEEQAAVRGDLVSLRPVDGFARGGGSSWQSLTRGTGSVEADWLNGEIVLLGRLHGIPVPVNETLRRLANRAARDRRAPGGLEPAQVAAAVEGRNPVGWGA
ncbi:ketopantoate reductase family protein [Actinacidiphila glaucinigra]|uniref:ketopantoate reductase family protein n=1 Tax=Actinacidiphila glaucinigra TaxID=235986 RepID=UPI0029BD7047|nr:2-dehydropantoate 2-reductase N-terminal domain-containing protein [Streptomyces sp. PA03-3a]